MSKMSLSEKMKPKSLPSVLVSAVFAPDKQVVPRTGASATKISGSKPFCWKVMWVDET